MYKIHHNQTRVVLSFYSCENNTHDTHSDAGADCGRNCDGPTGLVASRARPSKEKATRAAAIALLLLAVTGLICKCEASGIILLKNSLSNVPMLRSVESERFMGLRIDKPVDKSGVMVVSELVPVAYTADNPRLQPGLFFGDESWVRRGWPLLHQFRWAGKQNAADIWIVVISRTLFLCSLWDEICGFVSDYDENYVGIHICRHVVAEIFDLYLIHHRSDFAVKTERCGLQSKTRLAIQSNPRTSRLNELLLSGYGYISSETALPERKSSIDDEQTSRYFGPEQYLIAVGCIVVLGGVVLLFKVIDKVYSGSGFNVDMAVGGFFLAAILFWIGMALLGIAFHFVPVGSLHGRDPVHQVSNQTGLLYVIPLRTVVREPTSARVDAESARVLLSGHILVSSSTIQNHPDVVSAKASQARNIYRPQSCFLGERIVGATGRKHSGAGQTAFCFIANRSWGFQLRQHLQYGQMRFQRLVNDYEFSTTVHLNCWGSPEVGNSNMPLGDPPELVDWGAYWLDEPQVRSLVGIEIALHLRYRLIRRLLSAHYCVLRSMPSGDHFVPLFIGKNGVSNDSKNANHFKNAHGPFPYALCLALFGFCLYAYGFLSAKLGYGSNWSIVAFVVGIILCLFGVNAWLGT